MLNIVSACESPIVLLVWRSCPSIDYWVLVKYVLMLKSTYDRSVKVINNVINARQKFQQPYV